VIRGDARKKDGRPASQCAWTGTMNSGPSSAPAWGPACSVAARCDSVLDASAYPRRSSNGRRLSSSL